MNDYFLSVQVLQNFGRLSKVATANDDFQVTTPPSKWPGLDTVLAVLSREKDEETPQLRLLILETYIAVRFHNIKYNFSF